MTTSEISLLDTNVLVYAADETSPFHQASRNLRDRGLRGEISLCLFPQIFYEFFAIVTDPRRVQNPRSKEEAVLEIEKYYQADYLLKMYAGPDVMEITLDLLKRYEIRKQEIFDLQLVATMLSNNVTGIFTFNQDHFGKYKEIEVMKP
jgi:predicted nucleic acid-binding protein